MHFAVLVTLRLVNNHEKREAVTVEPAPSQGVWDLLDIVEVAIEQPLEASTPPDRKESATLLEPAELSPPRPSSPPKPPSNHVAPADPPIEVLPSASGSHPAPVEPSGQAQTISEPVAQPSLGMGLSLAELGIEGTNPFLLAPGATGNARGGAADVPGTPTAFPRGPAYQAHARLQRSLSSAALHNDQQLGLGPEGPVVTALTELTYEAADTAANGQAQIRIVTNARGEVVQAIVLSASSHTAAWERIVRRLLERLGKQALRVAGRALTLDFQVKSREQLPSGRSPGLAVRSFGQELKKGEGPNSSAIVILEPGLQEVPLYNSPDAPTVKVPALVLLGINADPVDIGAAARRMVHVTLERMVVN